VTVHRLSPKNQVTIPREARLLAAPAKVEHLRAKRHVVRKTSTKEVFRIVVLMTESELNARESRIHARADLSDEQKFEYITKLNDAMKLLALDAQNRVVLPADCLEHLEIGDGRDVKFVCTNSVVQVWNPDHFQQFSGPDDERAFDPVLNGLLL
jgi:DNA-binding transcriptional regulator/RsmH inhibitor MraZ